MKSKTRKYDQLFIIWMCIICLFGCTSIDEVQEVEEKKNPILSVTYIDVGQGDSSLIECEGKTMLIDGGLPSQSQKIYSILKERNIDHLDYIVCTHTHSDHVGGLSGALQLVDCDLALVNRTDVTTKTYTKFLAKLEEKNTPIEIPEVGNTYSFAGGSFVILGPTDQEDAQEENDRSIVVKLNYGNTSFLFTGDSEQEEEQLMMFNEYDELHADVLKVAHHGSSNGASKAWIKAVQPSISVISCGKNNEYGHPHEELLNLLKDANSQVYRTDLQGDITVTTDGNTVQVSSVEKNEDANVWQPGEKKQ